MKPFHHFLLLVLSISTSSSQYIPLTYDKLTSSFYITTYISTNTSTFPTKMKLDLQNSLTSVPHNPQIQTTTNPLSCEDESCSLIDVDIAHCEHNPLNNCINSFNNNISYYQTHFNFNEQPSTYEMVYGVNTEQSTGVIGLNAGYSSFVPVYVKINNLNRKHNVFSFCYSNSEHNGYARFVYVDDDANNNTTGKQHITYEITENNAYALYINKIDLLNEDNNTNTTTHEYHVDYSGILSLESNNVLLPANLYNKLLNALLSHIEPQIQQNIISFNKDNSSFTINEDNSEYIHKVFPTIQFQFVHYSMVLFTTETKEVQYNWKPSDYLSRIDNSNSTSTTTEYTLQIAVNPTSQSDVVLGSAFFNDKEITLNLNNKSFSFITNNNCINSNTNININTATSPSSHSYTLHIIIIAFIIVLLITFIISISHFHKQQILNKPKIELGFLVDPE